MYNDREWKKKENVHKNLVQSVQDVFFVAILLVELWKKPQKELKREENEKRGEASVCGVAAFERVMLRRQCLQSSDSSNSNLYT